MSTKILIKRSSTPNAIPTTGQLEQAELAVNLADKKLYTKDQTNAVVEISPTNATNATNATNLTGTSTANIQTSALASGTANSTTFLRGDRTWQTISTTPTTAQVLSATAGASTGAVGTYAFLGIANTSNVSTGGTLAGSSLRYIGIRGVFADNTVDLQGHQGNGGTPSGTWRAMGRANRFFNIPGGTIWLRIS